MGDVELAAVGVGAGVGHRKDAGAIVPERLINLVAELIAGAASPIALWVATLNHEALDDAVERQTVIIRLVLFLRRAAILRIIFGAFRQPDKVGDRQWRFLILQLDEDFPFGSLHLGVNAIRQRFLRFF